ncbi:hypothetical protein Pint_14538 [Pistacia integerrima]|uniref:Uncharacterized protein n=1 Tax=Pistacia integerrima TaxID=434235 RepID=A0ACC0Y7T1_9ROSI|nr:hypothetical protein Pint_14538 [Pistacia integerrima]
MASSSSLSLHLLLLFAILAILATLIESKPTFQLPGASFYKSSFKQAKVPKPKIPYNAHYFPQVLDHFTFHPKSSKIFYQKYLINSHYWHKGGPIFVYTGNEGHIEWFAANTGFLLDIAPKFKALLVFIEHRFYGESMPFGKDSYKSAETLGYLNSQQVLADYAVLIRSLKHNLSSESSPVVVFGGSYGGIATNEYDASMNCYEVIKGSWAELDALSVQKEGLAELSKIFRTCKDLHSADSALDWLWDAFVYTAMVNYPTEANFMKPLPAYPVQQMCKIIDGMPPETTKLRRAIAGASLYYNYSQTEKCFEIEHGADVHVLSGWNWQACTEMIMPMTCSNKSMFPPSGFDYKDVERIELALKRFGSNIIFSNGMQDPWSRGGVLKNISSSIIALVTKKGAHHVDFRFETKDDPDWLVELRRQEVDIIQKWIHEYYADVRQG